MNIEPLLPGLLTGSVTVAIFLTKDIVLAYLVAKKDEQKKERERLRLYVEPLVVSASKLFWRLDEVFNAEGRGVYLRSDVPDSEYNRYKKVSTLYRLASLLGWKRAFRRELMLVNIDLVSDFDKVEKALVDLEKSLADGSSVELQRLSNIEEVWRVDLKDKISNQRRAEVAVRIEQLLDSLDTLEIFSGKTEIESSSNLLQTVPDALARLFKSFLNIEIPSATVDATRAQITNALCIREAWVYREWQEAIGDLMIENISHSGRRFDIIGYQKFSEICGQGSTGDRLFLDKLKRLVVDIDIRRERDSRVQVLWAIYVACAQFITRVAEIYPKTSLISLAKNEAICKAASSPNQFKLLPVAK